MGTRTVDEIKGKTVKEVSEMLQAMIDDGYEDFNLTIAVPYTDGLGVHDEKVIDWEVYPGNAYMTITRASVDTLDKKYIENLLPLTEDEQKADKEFAVAAWNKRRAREDAKEKI